jgi:5-(carboxyamino)imidazole ribonucleotide synthase
MTTTIGILGGGQLGRMLAQAATKLDIEVRCYDASPTACAGDVCPLTVGAFDDADAIARFAEGCDAITYEFENVPVVPVRALEARGVTVHPSSRSLEVAQDRLLERQLFAELNIDAPNWLAVNSVDDLRRGLEQLGERAILKTRRFGYDGKGQAIVESADHAESAWADIGGAPAIVDRIVPFVREISCVVVRTTAAGARTGQAAVRTYPIGTNAHSGGILRESLVPDTSDAALHRAAQRAAERVAETLGHVGVLAVEFFVTESGGLLANEIAPRVHNTGHWTIEGAAAGQFENHMRAVAGLPLGETAFADGVTSAAMVNLIGGVPGGAAERCRAQGLFLHDYGKAARPGRKVGHITVTNPTDASLAEARALAEEAVGAGGAA